MVWHLKSLATAEKDGKLSMLDAIYIYIGCGPLPVTVTRIVTCLIGNPYKPSFATVTGRGPHPIYIYIYIFMTLPCIVDNCFSIPPPAPGPFHPKTEVYILTTMLVTVGLFNLIMAASWIG